MKKHQAAQSACGACCTQLQHLSVQLEGMPILQDVSLHLHCGEMTAIIGPNGAGKTTLFKAILKQVPYQGQITFTDAQGKRVGAPRIGYVPQNLSVDPLAPVTVSDFFGAALTRHPAFLPQPKKHRERIAEILAKTGAQALGDRRLGALSGGELQRVLLALALAQTPNLLLLDEPVSGIDAQGLFAFYALLDQIRRDADLSILLISHDFAFVQQYADRALLLNHSVLALGPPREVMATQAFSQLFPVSGAKEGSA